MSVTRVEISMPDDWHVHLRDGEALEHVVAATAMNFRRAIVMPNLKPPVTTVEMALNYRLRILGAVEKYVGENRPQLSDLQIDRLHRFDPLMVLYLTGATTQDEIRKATHHRAIKAVKLYPAGATTNSDAGVSDLLGQCSSVLEVMQELGMPLLIHGEVTDQAVDVFDREAVFIERVMLPLRDRFPELRVVFEHITTRQAAEYVEQESRVGTNGLLNLAATITPQHLLYNRNAIFTGGLQPHWYCLPVLKREEHRQALLRVATSGKAQFFLGTDSAPHARHLKEASCGCAGCYSAPYAMGLYAEAFASVGALAQSQAGAPSAFEKFCSLNGPAFYGLPVNSDKLVLEKTDIQIPATLPFVTESGIVPLRAGEVLTWSVGQGR